MTGRRRLLIGLGGLLVGGGTLLGTGAFSTVEATRTVAVESADDADALLGLEPARESLNLGSDAFVEQTDGTIEIDIDADRGLNERARTTFDHLILLTNRGSRTIEELVLEFSETPADVDPAETFAFPVADTDGDDITSEIGVVDTGENVLTAAETPSDLEPTTAVVVGLEIDLLNGGADGDLPEDGEYTLRIEANVDADDEGIPPEPAIISETNADTIIPNNEFGDVNEAQYDALEAIDLADPFTLAIEAPERDGERSTDYAVTAFYDAFDETPNDRLSGPSTPLAFDEDGVASVTIGSAGTGADVSTGVAFGDLRNDASLVNTIEVPAEAIQVAVETTGANARATSHAERGDGGEFTEVTTVGDETSGVDDSTS